MVQWREDGRASEQKLVFVIGYTHQVALTLTPEIQAKNQLTRSCAPSTRTAPYTIQTSYTRELRYMCNVTLTRNSETTVALEKQ